MLQEALVSQIARVTCLYEQMQQALVAKRDAEQKKNLADQQYEDAVVRWQEEQATLSQVMRTLREAGVPYEAARPTDEAVDAEESHEVKDEDDGYMSDDVDAAAPTTAAAVTDLTGPAAPTGGSSSD